MYAAASVQTHPADDRTNQYSIRTPGHDAIDYTSIETLSSNRQRIEYKLHKIIVDA